MQLSHHKPFVILLVLFLLAACAKEEQPHAPDQTESLTTTILDWGDPQQGVFEM